MLIKISIKKLNTIKIMNDLYLTTIFASLFTFIYLFLSFRVGYFRGSPVMRLIFRMDDKINETKLVRNVRSHGNFSEYVPLFLILLLILEIKNETPFLYLLITCLIFLYGRLAHAICFSFYEFNPCLSISEFI